MGLAVLKIYLRIKREVDSRNKEITFMGTLQSMNDRKIRQDYYTQMFAEYFSKAKEGFKFVHGFT